MSKSKLVSGWVYKEKDGPDYIVVFKLDDGAWVHYNTGWHENVALSCDENGDVPAHHETWLEKHVGEPVFSLTGLLRKVLQSIDKGK